MNEQRDSNARSIYQRASDAKEARSRNEAKVKNYSRVAITTSQKTFPEALLDDECFNNENLFKLMVLLTYDINCR
jgi:hypothetical protein